MFVDNRTGRATISYRGTDTKNWGDIGSDALLALGLERFSARFRNARKVARQALAKYGAGNVAVTGHSLGGSQALYVNSRMGIPATAFNPGTSLPQARIGVRDLIIKRKGKRRTDAVSYVTGAGDPISALTALRDSKVRKVKTTAPGRGVLAAHSMQNFLAPQ